MVEPIWLPQRRGGGFNPPNAFRRSTGFKTARFDHSGPPPRRKGNRARLRAPRGAHVLFVARARTKTTPRPLLDDLRSRLDEHSLPIYASAIAFRAVVALIPLILLGLGLLGAL